MDENKFVIKCDNSGYKKIGRRSFMTSLLAGTFLFASRYFVRGQDLPKKPSDEASPNRSQSHSLETTAIDAREPKKNMGVAEDGKSDVFFVKGGTPEENMRKTLELLGGITNIIDKDDIVVLKPNAQWWNQGMTNTNAMKAFMEEILAIPGFKGEIIIADNHQYAEPNSRGWTTDLRNGDFNYNELISFFHDQGYKNVTKYHWRGAGPNPSPIEGDDQLGSKIVEGPWDGDGYVWCRDIVYESSLGRRCLLTYPI
ncbi:MAG: hypothetical protein KAV87_05025, partial [Desulfobacteraceae bacterium]|nr:hypothetical protein [Desulfobacteraceae bacterium]